MVDCIQVRVLVGPLKNIHWVDPKQLLHCLGCVLMVIVLLEGEPLSHPEDLSTLDQVFIKDISTLCSVQLSLNLDQSLSPWRLKKPHSIVSKQFEIWPLKFVTDEKKKAIFGFEYFQNEIGCMCEVSEVIYEFYKQKYSFLQIDKDSLLFLFTKLRTSKYHILCNDAFYCDTLMYEDQIFRNCILQNCLPKHRKRERSKSYCGATSWSF